MCAPSLVQYAGLAALEADVSGHVQDYRRKRDLVWERLQGAFDVVRRGGEFYLRLGQAFQTDGLAPSTLCDSTSRRA